MSKGSSPVPVRTAAATGVVSNAAAKTNSDSGFSNTSSPNNQACIVAKKSEKSFQLLSHLQTTLVEKDQEITKLRNHIKELKPRLELMSSRNGQIEIGLSFYHISSRLRIDIISANNLRAVNLHGDHSDPFVKVKLFWQNPGGKTDKWKFETKTVWRTINPIWKEQ